MKLLPVLFLSLALPVLAPADLKQIQGTWKPTSATMGGTPLPKAMLDKMVLIVKGDTYDYDEGHGHDIGKLKDVKGKPMGMDIIGTKGPNEGKTYHTIYKVEGSDLTIKYGLDGKRPNSFDQKAKEPTILIKYHRSS